MRVRRGIRRSTDSFDRGSSASLAIDRLATPLSAIPGILPVLSILALTSCAASMPFVCPAQGGPAWREVSSDHVLVLTDQDGEAAAGIVRELEYTRALLLQEMFSQSVEVPGRVEVVALATPDEFVEFTAGDDKKSGYFYRDALGRQRIAVSGGIGEYEGMTIAHEMAHMLSAHFVPRQPHWLSEGVAMYFETLGRRDQGRRRTAGGVPDRRRVRDLRVDGADARDVLTWNPDVGEERRYGSSWLLVHFLMNQRPDAFEALQRRLVHAEDPEQAWNAVFPEWSLARKDGPESLDGLLAEYLSHGSFTYREVSGRVEERVDVRLSERPLSGAEVHAIRLRWPRSWSEAALQGEIGEALREDPGHVAALSRKAARDPASAVALARLAVKAHPEDPEAWTFLAVSLRGTKAVEAEAALRRAVEAEAALRKAVERAPDQPYYLALLATALVDTENWAEAWPLSRRAVQLAPWSPLALSVHAKVLWHRGDCAVAASTMKRAAEVWREGTPKDVTAMLATESKRMERDCGGPAVSR